MKHLCSIVLEVAISSSLKFVACSSIALCKSKKHTEKL